MRKAMTLIEVLVGIGIVSIMVGLLIPAVQKVRDSATRARCCNNIRQLAQACHTYEGQYKALPSGGQLTQVPHAPEGWGWQIHYYHEGNKTLHRCPSKPGPRIFPQWGTDTPTMMTDYAGADWDGGGVFVNAVRGIRLTDLSNGSSNTLMFGEKRLNIAQASVGRNYNDDYGAYAGWDHDILCTTSLTPMPDFQGRLGTATDSPAYYSLDYGDARFGGSHTGGFNIAHCDGSTRFITYNIDASVWRQSGRR